MKFNPLFMIAAFIVMLAACKSGPTKTPSGYEYVVVKKGSGDAAKAGDHVSFTIRIVGEDGKVLQEMGEGPNMPVLQIPDTMSTGKEANPLMEVLVGSRVGDSIVMTYPIDSMPNAPMDVASMKFIKYEMSVKKIQNKADFEKMAAVLKQEADIKAKANMEKLPAIEELIKTTLSDYKSKKLEVQTTASGLKYYIQKQGEGANAAVGSTVDVQYYGTLLDGKRFDDSYSRGNPIQFKLGVGQVIKGWDEGIALLNKGAKAFFFIPAGLAYGEAGSPPMIPANSELMFYVELDSFK